MRIFDLVCARGPNWGTTIVRSSWEDNSGWVVGRTRFVLTGQWARLQAGKSSGIQIVLEVRCFYDPSTGSYCSLSRAVLVVILAMLRYCFGRTNSCTTTG